MAPDIFSWPAGTDIPLGDVLAHFVPCQTNSFRDLKIWLPSDGGIECAFRVYNNGVKTLRFTLFRDPDFFATGVLLSAFKTAYTSSSLVQITGDNQSYDCIHSTFAADITALRQRVRLLHMPEPRDTFALLAAAAQPTAHAILAARRACVRIAR